MQIGAAAIILSRTEAPPPGAGRDERSRAAMNHIDSGTLRSLWDDFDAREVTLRRVVQDRLGENPPPRMDDHVVATYYFALRTMTLKKAVAEISYHATSGV